MSFGDTKIHAWLITWCHRKLQISVVGHASSFLEVDIQDPGSLTHVSNSVISIWMASMRGSFWCLALSIIWYPTFDEIVSLSEYRPLLVVLPYTTGIHVQLLQAPPSTLSDRHLSAPHLHIKPPPGLTYVGISQLQGIWCTTLAYLARGYRKCSLKVVFRSRRPNADHNTEPSHILMYWAPFSCGKAYIYICGTKRRLLGYHDGWALRCLPKKVHRE